MSQYRFGEFVLDSETRQLLRASQPRHVSPKAFHLLEVLVSSRPRVWSKRELQDLLWPDTTVVEANLPNLVAEVRSALEDDPQQSRFVRTVHRYGYGFVEPASVPVLPRFLQSATTGAGEFFGRRAKVLHAGKLQLGEFLDLHRRLGFRGGLAGFGDAELVGGGGAGKFGANRIPDFVGIDLRLAQADKVVGDGFFVVEAEMLGVGANESFIEDAAGKLIEVLFFDGLQHARTDLGDVGNVIEREFFFLARLTKFVSELAHAV